MIIIPLENQQYQEYINTILNTRTNQKDDDHYMEHHHITPKCLKGTDDKENLIWLYPEEHYYAHKLLALENPEIKELQCAWWQMCHCQGKGHKREYIPNAEEYAIARKNFVDNFSGENNPYYGHSGEKSAWYGSTHSEASRRKISEARRKQSPKKQKEVAKIISDETKKKMSENHYDCSGKNNPRAKKVLCIETNQTFDTAKEAGEYYHLTPSNPGSTIRRCCKNGGTTGYDTILNLPLHWKYVEEDIV